MARRGAVALLLALLVAAGCGSGTDDAADPSPTTDLTPTTTVAAPTTTAGLTTTAPPRTDGSALVDRAWLEDSANQFVLVDVRSAEAYAEGHIPGAVNLPSNQLDDPDAAVGSQVSSAQVVAAAVGAVGITPDDTVVLYDGTSSLYAARVFFAMRLYGHDDLLILDGGTIAWDGELTTDTTPVTATDYPVGYGSGAVRYDLPEVAEHLDSGGSFADARAPSEYTGATRFGDEQGGHIPGAVNLDWEQTVGADGRFLATDELRGLYAAAGITPDSPVVTYCYIGVRAAHTWFVLHELLGYPDVALYDGSWSEYGTTAGVEIET